MGDHTNTITLNGKLYDTRSGVVVGEQPHATARQTLAKGQVLDGVVRSKPNGAKAHTPSSKPLPGHHHRQSVTANHIHHKTEPTHTLMRTVVKKPLHAKASKSTAPAATNAAKRVMEPVISHQTQLSAHRVARAHTIPKSKLVSRFVVPGAHSSVVKKTAALSVKAAPHAISHHSPDVLASPVSALSSTQDFFADAIGQATSHEARLHKLPRRRGRLAKKLGIGSRALNISASLMVAVALGGFIAYQNMANVTMRVAAARAGMQATLPGYKPSGFSLSRDIRVEPGRITVSFRSNSDKRSFNITQQTSNWKSDTLLHSFVATSDQPYQRVSTTNGQTIYLYGDTNATWVDGGIWYQVEGKSSLSSEQLLRMAASF